MALMRLLIACPAAGKTTWCARNAAHLGTVFSLDETRARLGRHAHDQAASPAAIAEVRAAMTQTLRAGGDVTLDATSATAQQRATWLDVARECGATPTAVLLRIPLDVALGRNSLRGRPVPPAVLTGIWHQVDAVTSSQLRREGFATVTEIDPIARSETRA